MLIRVILLLGLAAVGYYGFLRRNQLPFHILFLGLLLAAGSVFVVAPELTNAVARFVGVGRGADLINYLAEIGLLFIAVHYYTKFVELDRRLTTLTREVALLTARPEPTEKK